MRSQTIIGLCILHLFVPTIVKAQDSTPSVDPPAIPFVATHHDTVRDMLWMAEVGEEDVVYDLGSGDGRIVIAAVRDFGARRAVGVEINPDLIQESRRAAQDAEVADRVEFIEGDLFAADFSEASVLTLFVGKRENLELRAKLYRELKPGTRVVSHQFGMGEWSPDKSLDSGTNHQRQPLGIAAVRE
jgi:SAM-dependent methyltransferase